MITLQYQDFRPVERTDQTVIAGFLARAGRLSCEMNFCNIFHWGPVYDYRWAVNDDLLLISLDRSTLLFPCGRDIRPDELAAVSDLFRAAGHDGNYSDVPDDYVQAHREELEKYFELDTCEDDYDYIYAVDKLVKLSGAKLRKKRNLISQFEREYTTWHVAELTPETAVPCIPFIEYLYRDTGMDDMQQDDFAAIKRAVQYFGQTGIRGLGLYVNNRLAAFSMFSRQNPEAYTVHFEKNDRDIKGSAQVINQQTAKLLQNSCRYLNREQDLGVDGLRHAKQSYDPEFMLKNHHLIRKGGSL